MHKTSYKWAVIHANKKKLLSFLFIVDDEIEKM